MKSKNRRAAVGKCASCFAEHRVAVRRERRERFAVNGFEMARQEMIGDEIDEDRCEAAQSAREAARRSS